MTARNPLQDKSFNYAVETIRVYKNIVLIHKDFIIARQFLRSGTSIGANIEEAIGGYSKKDFCSKLSIAYKESRENHFWIKLLFETGYIKDVEYKLLEDNLVQICKMLYKSIESTRKKIQTMP